jgi:hypothetical protein
MHGKANDRGAAVGDAAEDHFLLGLGGRILETARLPAVTRTAEDCVVTSTSAVTGVAADKLCGATHSWQASGQLNQ